MSEFEGDPGHKKPPQLQCVWKHCAEKWQPDATGSLAFYSPVSLRATVALNAALNEQKVTEEQLPPITADNKGWSRTSVHYLALLTSPSYETKQSVRVRVTESVSKVSLRLVVIQCSAAVSKSDSDLFCSFWEVLQTAAVCAHTHIRGHKHTHTPRPYISMHS